MKKTMKILYGVQATGQGHITRARVLGPALQRYGADVDFLFSGRKREDMYGMEPFGEFEVRRGLTFYFNHGQVSPFLTVKYNNCFELLRDVLTLDVSQYDLVITDYEPITAWAAKIKRVPSLGIGHQYAFRHDIPRTGFNIASLAAMNWLAPAKESFGIHWHHFDHPVIPPMFDPPSHQKDIDPRKIVVYLNFEDVADIRKMLDAVEGFDFYIYSSQVRIPSDEGALKFRPLSNKFKEDIEDCAGVICGAGFELPTETMHMGKKLLVKAMDRQPEQLSNALAIKLLGIGDVMSSLDRAVVRAWLTKPQAQRVVYPDAADAFARWIVKEDRANPEAMIKNLWSRVDGLHHLSI